MIADIPYLDYQLPLFFEWPEGIKYKVIPKGRRAGVTRGAANAFIEWLLDGETLLWGETTHGNIERYFERYFYPVLNSNKIIHKFDRQSKKLTIGKGYCDFRSADAPENWEGFGYHKIFLNEAGIILKNRSLYINSVLPMLLDFPNSKLIAAGVPKGKFLKEGPEHPFYTLAKRANSGHAAYQLTQLTSYSNPILSEKDIAELEEEIALFSAEQVRQEIYGEFIETDALNPFATQFDPEFHVSEIAVHDPLKQLYISVDFNLNPFAVTFWHFWQELDGYHLHGIDEAEIANGNIEAMNDLINLKYSSFLHTAVLTGDHMGSRKDIGRKDNASHYMEMQKGLHLSDYQLKVFPNPTHKNSRTDVNKVLYEAKKTGGKFHVKLHPKNMQRTIRDFKTVQCDAFGEILKKNRNDLSQRADYMDAARYVINVTCKAILMKLFPDQQNN